MGTLLYPLIGGQYSIVSYAPIAVNLPQQYSSWQAQTATRLSTLYQTIEEAGLARSITPTVVDLFCGCGGFSLGAARAGFNVGLAIDNDVHALQTHKKNFPLSLHLAMDLSTGSGAEILESSGYTTGEIDGVIGGPPCQGFSAIGRQLASDTRNQLFAKFFRLVDDMQPKFFVCENVPGLFHSKYNRIRLKATRLISDNYNSLQPMRLRACDYGAPTIRTRYFVVGFRKDLDIRCNESDFLPRPDVEPVRVRDALKGLPKKISPDWQSEVQGWKTVGISFNGAFGLRLGGHIPDGVGDTEAIRELKECRRVSGCLGTRHASEVAARFSNVAPGEIDPVSRFPRLDPNNFCPTLRAGTGVDKGSHQAARPIHPSEDRVITPREAARLQGFPDWFQFDPTKWHSFRQIGNSVSPILAESVLSVIYKKLLNKVE